MLREMDEAAIRSDERRRVAAALRRYFDDMPPHLGTFRGLIEYLDVDYRVGMDEGWLDLNDAMGRHSDRAIAWGGEPSPPKRSA